MSRLPKDNLDGLKKGPPPEAKSRMLQVPVRAQPKPPDKQTLPLRLHPIHRPGVAEARTAQLWAPTSGLGKEKTIMFVLSPFPGSPLLTYLQKEVERRRRGNINEGINELGRIVPSGSGEKAKGAILARAVQYIHHLKENEARNIEKWTLEKLLMDQAMGDLQAQLEEVKRMWEEERMARARVEAEVDILKATSGVGPKDEASTSKKRNADGQDGTGVEESERDGKRPRVD